MNENIRHALRSSLQNSYEELKRRLTQKFGSVDTATEALHEVFIRLDNVSDATMVRKPKEFLYRAAVNAALDGYRASARQKRLHADLAVAHGEEDPLTPERIVIARSEIALLETVLKEMPARRRAIFMAVLIEGKVYREVAEELDLSKRLIISEVVTALEHAYECFQKRSEKYALGSRDKRHIDKRIQIPREKSAN